jgi:endoglucanase
MKKILLIFLTFISPNVLAQSTSFEIVEEMGRGINLGNVLSAPTEGNWAFSVYEEYFDQVKDEGFSNVRIPVDFFGGTFLNADYTVNGGERTLSSLSNCDDNSCFSELAGTQNQYDGSPDDYYVNPLYLDRLQQIVDWSMSKGLVTIIDFHGAKLKENFLYTFDQSDINGVNYYSDPTSEKRIADLNKFKAIWRDIAERFKDYPETLLFEISSDIINIVRSSGSNNESRKIIITGGDTNSWEVIFQIPNELINSDPNLIATFHYYQPMSFTSSMQENNNTFNLSQNAKNQITQRFSQINSWSTTNNIPVYLGEFGADNGNGINYWVGGSNGTFGGPNPADRIEYHRHIAEQAILNNFSFSAWCAGNKSTKTISLRTDNPENENIIAGNWVEEVKDALLGIGCYSTEDVLIQNPDFECGINNGWDLSTFSGAQANFSETETESYEGKSARIEVTELASSNSGFNKVILNNQEYDQDLSGKTINIKFNAKANSNNNESVSIKIRLKLGISGNNYIVSDELTLSSEYNLYEFEFDIDETYDAHKLQVLCGNAIGEYFFDNFETIINDQSFSNDDEILHDVVFFPIPFENNLYFNSNQNLDVSIYSIDGKLISVLKLQSETGKVNLDFLEKGVYILKYFAEGANYYKRIIKN